MTQIKKMITADLERFRSGDPNRVQPMSEISSSYSAEGSFRQTVALLGEAQVSVYPVDARGLAGSLVSDVSGNLTDETGQFLTGADYAAAITKGSSKIVELHGGKIGVTSQLGRGSLFYFSLPMV